MDETLTYQFISFATVLILSLLWRICVSGWAALSTTAILVVVFASLPLIYFYPQGVFACQVCGSTYVLQHIILGAVVFIVLATIMRIVLRGRAI